MEKNKVKLHIGGAEYSILTDDDVQYALSLGKDLDLALNHLMKENARLSTTQAAVMLALGYADELKKTGSAEASLREQIKDYLEDASSAKKSADLAKREAEKAKRALEDANLEIGRLKAQLASVLDSIGNGKKK